MAGRGPTDREQRVLGIIETARAKRPKFRDARITMAHGAGGKATADADRGPARAGVRLRAPSRRWPTPARSRWAGSSIALTTDSFVVKPIRFPGGSIGELAVNGTVNDLAVAGARPLALSLSLVLEEGLPADELRAEVEAIAAAAAAAGVEIIAGDTKVVERGHADSMYVCTAGIGQRRSARAALAGRPAPRRPDPGVRARSASTARRSCSPAASSSSTPTVESDTRPLWPAVDALLEAAGPGLRCLRDATRGGVASVLNELARASGVAMVVREGDVPVRPAVAGAAELLGIDPMYVANEGKLVAFVAPERGRCGAAGAARRAGVRAGGGDRRGQDRAAGDGAGGDGVRRQAGDGPAGRRSRCRGSAERDERRGRWRQSSSYRTQAKTEAITAHVLWMTTGLSCEGDSGGHDLGHQPEPRGHHPGDHPGMPRVVIHNQVVAYEVGQEYIQAWYDAEAGKLDPFVLIIEGSIGNEEINGEGHWTGFGVNRTPASRSRPTTGSTGSPTRRPPWSPSAPAPPTAASPR